MARDRNEQAAIDAANRQAALEAFMASRGLVGSNPWGTASPISRVRDMQSDDGMILAPGSGPETFMRNGVEYARLGDRVQLGEHERNPYWFQNQIYDPEFGWAVPAWVQQYTQEGNDFFTNFGPALALGGLLGVASPAFAANAAAAGAAPATQAVQGSLGGLSNASIAAGAETLGSLGAGGGTFATTTGGGLLGSGAGMGAGLATNALGGIGSILPSTAGTTGALGSLGLNAANEIVPNTVDLAKTATAPSSSAPVAPNTTATSGATSALSRFFNGTATTDDYLSLAGKVGSIGLGLAGANQQANAQENLAKQWMDLGAPYRAQLAELSANPSSFYSSPMVQGALQQGSDSLARSLSAKVGNPILNPTALQEMQNFTTRGLLDQYNTRFSQLANAGQLGLGPAANFSGQAANSAGNTYNALGAGLKSVLGRNPYQEMAEAFGQIPGLAKGLAKLLSL